MDTSNGNTSPPQSSSSNKLGHSISLRRNQSTKSQTDSNKPRRQKSLVRPERERNDPNSRLYHYRQRAGNPDTIGNQAKPLERKPTKREQLLRRGKSILGREEKQAENGIGATVNYLDPNAAKGSWFSEFNPWMTYCYLITCCFPKPVLRFAGIPDGPAQRAWREKIGLVSFILFIMGCVGFLTFGFTQAACPIAPLTVRGGQVSPGYLIISGWAFMLAEWQHPVGPTNETTNVLYPPINAGGMDATFLFQQKVDDCDNVFIPISPQPVYFPCQLFNPNNTVAPSPSQITNQTSCHLTANAHNVYNSFQTQGVPNSKNGFDKTAKVYYEWEDITADSYLTVYNGNVLNLKLLNSISNSYYNIPANGLISNMMTNATQFVGKDITMLINGNHATDIDMKGWEQEAKCLSQTIMVGSMDTISIGCMVSDIVLYVSLAVILGVIGIKFILAGIFGWFLSWKLGNFKEGGSYRARMEREKEIENWATNMQAGAPLTKPRIKSVYVDNSNKRKTLLPQTSKFSQAIPNSTRYNGEKHSSIFRTPNTALEGHVNRQSMMFGSDFANRQSTFKLGGLPSPLADHFSSSRVSVANQSVPPSPSVRFIDNNSSSQRRPSVNSNSGFTNTTETSAASNGPPCPLPLSPHVLRQPSSSYMPFNFPLAHTICLVTCYSEGEVGIRVTLDSIATSDYPNSHKLLLVICDGLITGSGESMSTPDVCVGMMRDFIVPPDQVQANSYVALADGSRQNNMAKVYAGFYKYDDNTIPVANQQRVPMITIVKCGTPKEQSEAAKPGNRGKRDSQIILMQFMQKIMFDERMTMMEYEFLNGIWRVAGVPPDVYEIVLMVDADTKLFPDALSRLISCAVRDPEITGMCGETKIANKTDSWVTMIQVFEYYISHHQSKAFESIFGGVTCLPGCFCMYRIKAPKGPDGYWVPILANPDIVERYSENIVDTLHKKNLLLLGEDRYLSTLMLRTFPNRKMMFVPQAVCKTVVPDTFSVLLSQRRRWINSTIHNLMELLFVHDLCGTFCFSMQFVIFMELVGTLALPAAISFTLYLIVIACMGHPAEIPLILLALILGLPAVLIVMTSRKVVYVGWMLIYLFSLPIWNFVLPTYAYWHFDDFSWGDTRKVEGEGNDKKGGHADKHGEFDSSLITMKKWSEYEKDRRVKEALEKSMPIPRFLEKKRATTVDIYRGATPTKRTSSSSAGSDESNIPIVNMGQVPSGATNKEIVDEDIVDDLIIEDNKLVYEQYSSERHAMNTTAHAVPSTDIPLNDLSSKNSEASSQENRVSYSKPDPSYSSNLASEINFDNIDDYIDDSNHITKAYDYSPTSPTNDFWTDPASHHRY